MPADRSSARENQRRRTRKDLLRAAARLVREGRSPSLDEVAEAALVSRATAYRYFPNIESLLTEAPLEIAMPDAATLFGPGDTHDPVTRVERVDGAVNDMIAANEAALRMMLINALQLRLKSGDEGVIARQNRRTPLIEAALEPAAARFTPATRDLLVKALGLVIGTEATIAFKDVLGLDDAEARQVRRWMIRSLIEAAATQ